MSKNCWMRGKQCGPSSDAIFCSIWLGSTLFSETGLCQYLGFFTCPSTKGFLHESEKATNIVLDLNVNKILKQNRRWSEKKKNRKKNTHTLTRSFSISQKLRQKKFELQCCVFVLKNVQKKKLKTKWDWCFKYASWHCDQSRSSLAYTYSVQSMSSLVRNKQAIHSCIFLISSWKHMFWVPVGIATPIYCTMHFGFSKLLEKLIVKYPSDKDFKER